MRAVSKQRLSAIQWVCKVDLDCVRARAHKALCTGTQRTHMCSQLSAAIPCVVVACYQRACTVYTMTTAVATTRVCVVTSVRARPHRRAHAHIPHIYDTQCAYTRACKSRRTVLCHFLCCLLRMCSDRPTYRRVQRVRTQTNGYHDLLCGRTISISLYTVVRL